MTGGVPAGPDETFMADALPTPSSGLEPPALGVWPSVGEAALGDDLVRPVSYWNEAAMTEAEDPTAETKFPSMDEIREELKRRDAKVKDSSEYGRGMTFVLDDEGKKYIRFLTWGQVWTSFTENNPGTIDADGDFKDNSLDIGLRRVRFLTYAQLTEKYLILLHVGINNQTFTTGGDTGTREFGSDTRGFGPGGVGKKPQVFVHDFWNEYTIFPQSEDCDFSLATGAGIHYWNGISRKSSSSTCNYMTVDSNIFCWPNIEFTDQFARQLGWYFKGKLHKLDYRFSVNHPFNTDDRASLNTARAVNIGAHTLSVAGYYGLAVLGPGAQCAAVQDQHLVGREERLQHWDRVLLPARCQRHLGCRGPTAEAGSPGDRHRLLLRQARGKLWGGRHRLRRVLHLRLR